MSVALVDGGHVRLSGMKKRWTLGDGKCGIRIQKDEIEKVETKKGDIYDIHGRRVL